MFKELQSGYRNEPIATCIMKPSQLLCVELKFLLVMNSKCGAQL